MGVVVKEPYNKFNIIIRTSENKREFFKDSSGGVISLWFNIYTQSFEIDKTYNIKISLMKSRDEKMTVDSLEGFDIAEYQLTKNGFEDQKGTTKKNLPSIKEDIGITEGNLADMRLNMEGIILEAGVYEIVAEVDGKIATMCPFIIKNPLA